MGDRGSLPRLETPPGTCDCHMHVYGPKETYPEAPTSPLPPPLAIASEYRKVMRRLGIERAVVVQPLAYGTDNRCTMDAVAEVGTAASAVVVVGPDTPDAELARLAQAGARGVRFNMLRGAVLSWEMLGPTADRIADHGWHVELQVDGRQLPDLRPLLVHLPVPLVIEHVGKFLQPVAPDHSAFKVLLGLVDAGRCWVKLSAPYETSRSGPPDYADIAALAKPLIATAPDRMLWASNWPHPTRHANPPDDAMLLDVLGYWCEDVTIRNRILADNPAELYGFAEPARGH